jgi:four helix bundle protein
MSQHTPSLESLPRSRTNLLALEVALAVSLAVQRLRLPRGLSHLRDHLARAADNTALRLAEASGRTMGHRWQHLEAAYAENQEVQCALALIIARGVTVPSELLQQADRLGGLVYGLLRSEVTRRSG